MRILVSRRAFVTAVKIAVLLICMTISACKSSGDFTGEIPPPQQARLKNPEKRQTNVNRTVKVGEKLEIFVTEDDSFNGVYPVRENGDIIIPLVGRIPVAGGSVKEAEKRVKLQLEQGQLAEATVIVDRISLDNKSAGNSVPGSGAPGEGKILVYVTGKVNRPGQHQIAVPEGRSLGVYEALLITGGMTRFGEPRKVHILRAGKDGKRVRVGVDVKRIMSGELIDMPIGEGDVIVVPEKVFGF